MPDVRAPSATPAVLLAVACVTIASGCSPLKDSASSDPVAPPSAAAMMTLSSPMGALIMEPDDQAVFVQGQPVAFVAVAYDAAPGSTGETLSWTSSRDGWIGAGASLTRTDLTPGEHVITLTASSLLETAAQESRVIHIAANARPSVTITAPEDGAAFAVGSTVAFAGSGFDAETGALAGDALVWTSDVNGMIGRGASFATAELTAGVHTIALTATDPHGVSSVAVVTLTVGGNANQAPTAVIAQPRYGAAFAYGASIDFVGSATDPEQGTLGAGSLVWHSDRDGQIGTGDAFSRVLSSGDHRISLTATDAQGASHREVYVITVGAGGNLPPTAQIISPEAGASFAQGATVLLSGAGSDPESRSLGGGSLTWSSSRDGFIGTGASLATNRLSVGSHVITLTVRDEQGASASVARSISIAAPPAGGSGSTGGTTGSSDNQAPTALMSTPAHRSVHAAGASVVFTGSASDPEDGPLTGSALVWRSDRDGQLGTGSPIARSTLSVGEHLISLTATDSHGRTYTHYRIIEVTTGASGTGGGTTTSDGDLSAIITLLDSSPETGAWVKTGTARSESNSAAPRSGPGVVRITFPTGFNGGAAPGSFYSGTAINSRTAFYETWLRLSDNYEGHSTNINKLVHFFVCGSNRLLLQGYGDDLTATLSFQGIALPYQWGADSRVGTSGHLTPNLGRPATFVRGRWHHVQILMLANTPGQANGAVTLWLDGQRVTHSTGIAFCGAGTNGLWEGVHHSPTWGGVGGTTSSTFYVEWDHVRLGRR